jgi:uncharacterized YigZ family protein
MKYMYHTIASPSEGQFRDRGSRFLAFAYPVSSEEEIRSRIDALKKEYHDARHHCYAWRLGADMKRHRMNDDGEPSGSAGRPIMGQLQSRELTEVLVVVVRYFGGTLLGVGGLIQAYRSAASAALEGAVIEKRKVEEELHLTFPYTEMNAVMKVVKEHGLSFVGQEFDTECSLTVRVWKRDLEAVNRRLSQITGCRLGPAGKL